MPECQFSETQFENYHSRLFEREYDCIAPQFFPTRNEEGYLGFDLFQQGRYENYFIQYKVPYYLLNRSRKCRNLQGNCFHIHLSNRYGRNSFPQYRMLHLWAQYEPNVFYATPMFGTQQDFARYYQTILNHTAYFRVGDPGFPTYGDPGFTTEHTLYYSDLSDFSYLYSEPKQVKKYRKIISESNSLEQLESFSEYVNNGVYRMDKILREINLPRGIKEMRKRKLLELLDHELSDSEKLIWLDNSLKEFMGLEWKVKFLD